MLSDTPVALVIDHDAGVDSGGAVTQAEVLRLFGENSSRLKALLIAAVSTLEDPEADATAGCPCRRALDGLALPFDLP